MGVHGDQGHGEHGEGGVVYLPSPTAWPMVLALGVALLLAGMVTSVEISLLGVLLMAFGSVGWFRQVLPVEQHEPAAIVADALELASVRTAAGHLPHGAPHRQ